MKNKYWPPPKIKLHNVKEPLREGKFVIDQTRRTVFESL